MSKTLVLKPRMSEKTYSQSQQLRVYTFIVPREANKLAVKRAVEDQFNVSVQSVNVTNIAGKAKRTIRKGGRPIKGRQSDIRKAYVTIAAGQSLPVFTAVEEAEKEAAKTAEKAAKEKK